MLPVESIGRIRRAREVQTKSIRSISTSMGVSHNTVRKVLRGEDPCPRYGRSVQHFPKLGGFMEVLETNSRKRHRERKCLMRIRKRLSDPDCEAGNNAVWGYAAAWRRRRGGGVSRAYVPLSVDPGEAYQFDWSHEYVVLGGVTVKVAHVRLCRSRVSSQVASNGILRISWHALRGFRYGTGSQVETSYVVFVCHGGESLP